MKHGLITITIRKIFENWSSVNRTCAKREERKDFLFKAKQSLQLVIELYSVQLVHNIDNDL